MKKLSPFKASVTDQHLYFMFFKYKDYSDPFWEFGSGVNANGRRSVENITNLFPYFLFEADIQNHRASVHKNIGTVLMSNILTVSNEVIIYKYLEDFSTDPIRVVHLNGKEEISIWIAQNS